MHILFAAVQILLISNFVSTQILITSPPTSSEQSPSTQSGPTSATTSPSGSPPTTPSATPSSAMPSSSGPPSSIPPPSGSSSTTPSPSGPLSTTPSGTPTPITSSTALTTTAPCTITGRFEITDPKCQKYYYCYVDGTNIVRYDLQCPNSLHFNPKLQKCVLPTSYPCTAT